MHPEQGNSLMSQVPQLRFYLGDGIDMLREAVQAFAAAEIAPRAADIDRENLFPADLWQKLGSLGVHGLTVPEEFGGAGLGLPRAHRGDGRDLARFGFGRALLWRALEPVHEPARAQRQRRSRSSATCRSS